MSASSLALFFLILYNIIYHAEIFNLLILQKSFVIIRTFKI